MDVNEELDILNKRLDKIYKGLNPDTGEPETGGDMPDNVVPIEEGLFKGRRGQEKRKRSGFDPYRAKERQEERRRKDNERLVKRLIKDHRGT